MQMRAYGRPPTKGVSVVDDRLLRGIFRVDKFPLILSFLSSESSSARDSHVSVFRALHALRRTSHYNTSSGNSYNLNEDVRIWCPTRAAPALSPYQLFASKIPLGTLAQTISEILHEDQQPQQATPAPTVAPVDEDALSELTASDATHVTLEYA
jgi:hypothetical protein